MRTMISLVAVLIMYLITGCASVRVQTDYDQDVDFSTYSTYKWMPAKDGRGRRSPFDNSLNRKRIHDAVDRELTALGYIRQQDGKTDLLITYHIGLQDRVGVTTHGYGTWRRPHRRVVHRYKESTLVLDMVDPQMKQLIWRGAGTGVIGRFDDIEKRIDNSVKAILKKFPPQ